MVWGRCFTSMPFLIKAHMWEAPPLPVPFLLPVSRAHSFLWADGCSRSLHEHSVAVTGTEQVYYFVITAENELRQWRKYVPGGKTSFFMLLLSNGLPNAFPLHLHIPLGKAIWPDQGWRRKGQAGEVWSNEEELTISRKPPKDDW